MTTATGIDLTGIRLLTLEFDGFGEERISFETDRSIFIVVDDVGVSERIHGIEAWVFVLLSDDVEPPVDVDWRCKFDVEEESVEPKDERRFVETGGLSLGFMVEVATVGIKRWARDWVLTAVVFGRGTVTGRIFGTFSFPFGNDEFITVGLFRAEAIRGTAFEIGAAA